MCKPKRNTELEGWTYVSTTNNIFVFGKHNLSNSIMDMVIQVTWGIILQNLEVSEDFKN